MYVQTTRTSSHHDNRNHMPHRLTDNTRYTMALLFGVAAVVAVGCGGGSSSNTTDSSPTASGSKYTIPPDNPFAAGGGAPEIYAWGLRNPWRWSFDLDTGQILLGDVGQGAWEEVDIIERGKNYGWSTCEGAHLRGTMTPCANSTFVDPIAEYDHSQGCSITGGYVYRGTSIASLNGVYFFGDFCTGTIWSLQQVPGDVPQVEVVINSGLSVASFAQSIDGEIYVVNIGGTLHKIVSALAPPQLDLQQVFPGLSFASPVYMLQAPGDSTRWFVVQRGGGSVEAKVIVFPNDDAATPAQTSEFISIPVDASGEGGLLGMAFHPDFPNTPKVFLSYTRTGPDAQHPLTTVISRFTSADGGLTLNPASEEEILTIDQPFANHNGGYIAFGPDGLLYIGLGDGGSGNDPLNSGQDVNTLLGAMLRIDVDTTQ